MNRMRYLVINLRSIFLIRNNLNGMSLIIKNIQSGICVLVFIYIIILNLVL